MTCLKDYIKSVIVVADQNKKNSEDKISVGDILYSLEVGERGLRKPNKLYTTIPSLIPGKCIFTNSSQKEFMMLTIVTLEVAEMKNCLTKKRKGCELKLNEFSVKTSKTEM